MTVGLVAGLHALGRGALEGPPAALDQLGVWAAARTPIEVGLALGRLVTLAVAYQLLLALGVGVVGGWCNRPRAVRAAERWTLPPLRRLVRYLAGVSLTTSTLLASPVGATGEATPGTAVMVVAPPSPVDARVISGPALPPLDASAAEPNREETGPAFVAQPEPAVHVVVAGDHLWAIASDQLSRLWDRTPSEAEIADHWRLIIDANPQIIDPDLVFVGDRVTLPEPEVPAPPTSVPSEPGATIRVAPT